MLRGTWALIFLIFQTFYQRNLSKCRVTWALTIDCMVIVSQMNGGYTLATQTFIDYSSMIMFFIWWSAPQTLTLPLKSFVHDDWVQTIQRLPIEVTFSEPKTFSEYFIITYQCHVTKRYFVIIKLKQSQNSNLYCVYLAVICAVFNIRTIQTAFRTSHSTNEIWIIRSSLHNSGIWLQFGSCQSLSLVNARHDNRGFIRKISSWRN